MSSGMLRRDISRRFIIIIIKGYSYSLSHSQTLLWRVRYETGPSWGRSGTAAMMA